MSRWLIEETGNGEDGFCWNLFCKDEDRLTMMATLYSESFARDMKSAMDWQDSLGSGLLSLAMDGIVFRADNGKVWTAPKRSRAPLLKIQATKKPRS